jgi:hypothetical protein
VYAGQGVYVYRYTNDTERKSERFYRRGCSAAPGISGQVRLGNKNPDIFLNIINLKPKNCFLSIHVFRNILKSYQCFILKNKIFNFIFSRLAVNY